jgi:hypothetical protein
MMTHPAYKKLFPLGHLPWGKLLFLRIGERLLTHSLERGIKMSDYTMYAVGNIGFAAACLVCIMTLVVASRRK